MITKQLYEAQLQQIFHMLLENKTNEQIASELKISVRTVQNYKQRLEEQYGSIWRQKTNDTLFLECSLFKNRMLTLYKALENQIVSDKTSGTDKAKCAEIAANIAIDILKLESQGIHAVKQLAKNNLRKKYARQTSSSKSSIKEGNGYDNDEYNIKEDDLNRKF